MSLPHTIYEAKLVQSDDRRERSLAMHEHLMHLPQGNSLLERFLDRLRAMSARASEIRPQSSTTQGAGTNRPPAFSK